MKDKSTGEKKKKDVNGSGSVNVINLLLPHSGKHSYCAMSWTTSQIHTLTFQLHADKTDPSVLNTDYHC